MAILEIAVRPSESKEFVEAQRVARALSGFRELDGGGFVVRIDTVAEKIGREEAAKITRLVGVCHWNDATFRVDGHEESIADADRVFPCVGLVLGGFRECRNGRVWSVHMLSMGTHASV